MGGRNGPQPIGSAGVPRVTSASGRVIGNEAILAYRSGRRRPPDGAKIAATMAATSAGLLLYRRTADGDLEVLLAHPGGPFWARKDDGAWSVPKGEYGPDEDPLQTAHREFEEELGLPAPDGPTVALGEIRQSGGKRVTVWAREADLDVAGAESNTFELEWPRGSGTVKEFPEVDRVAWMAVPVARAKLLKSQVPFLDRLLTATGPAERSRQARAGDQ